MSGQPQLAAHSGHQVKTDQMGLPIDAEGGLDPTGGMASIRSGRVGGPLNYGASGTMFNNSAEASNPLNSDVVVKVRNNCRKRLNEYMRMQGLPLLQPHEDPPALLMLIELREYTPEPLQTFARRNMKGMMIRLSVSQAVTVKWARIPYKAVPYEVREYPLYVADALLDQIKNFIILPIWDDQRRKYYGVKIPDEKKLQISLTPFREPREDELDQDILSGANGPQMLAVGEPGKALMLNMGGKKTVNVGGGRKLVDAEGRESYIPEPNMPRPNPNMPGGSTSIERAAPQNTPQQSNVQLPAQNTPANDTGDPAQAFQPQQNPQQNPQLNAPQQAQGQAR